MRLTERKVCYPRCDNQGNLDEVEYIAIKDKKIAEEKLCQLEDIEDELGIDLITLFKALKNGFYVKGEEEKQYIDFENPLNATAFKNKEMFYGHKWTYQYVKLKEYDKTWALTKEEFDLVKEILCE